VISYFDIVGACSTSVNLFSTSRDLNVFCANK
jgi:hypothetical protein